MDARDFETLYATLALPESIAPTETIRPEPSDLRGAVTNDLPLPLLKQRGVETPAALTIGPTIGVGGMGVVYSARQWALDREVAVKTTRTDRDDSETRSALVREGWVTGTLEHPSVVPVYDIGQSENNAPMVVMRRITGVSWESCIGDMRFAPHFESGDELAWHLEIFLRVCDAVSFAHSRGILHRDLKPANVMIGTFGEVYLVDWGVALSLDPSRKGRMLTREEVRSVAGTPAYMAPEMLSESGVGLGESTDVFLLGASLFHVLAGHAPYRARSLLGTLRMAFEAEPPEFPDDAPPEIVEIIHRAIRREPSERFQSAEELRRAISEFLRHRDSFALAREGASRLGELRRSIAGRLDDKAIAGCRQVFTECRFAFEQALRLWKGNLEAASALTLAQEAMAQLELETGNISAAEMLVSQVETPSADLSAALAAAHAASRRQRAKFEQLQINAEEHDLREGAQDRRKLAMLIGLFWCGIPFVSGFLTLTGRHVVDSLDLFHHSVLMFLVTLLLLFLIRKTVLANLANLFLAKLLVIWISFVVVFRILLLEFGIDAYLGLCLETSIYAVSLGATALLSYKDSWIWVGVLGYFAAALLGAQAPKWILICQGFANLVAVTWLVRIWSPDGPEVGTSRRARALQQRNT
ncbi:MAG: serine/threonine-protein kinase [Candidatus Binatia bacterium]|nr:serine/threonine-protein kinase [Candidatus Binatia bacterium]